MVTGPLDNQTCHLWKWFGDTLSVCLNFVSVLDLSLIRLVNAFG